MRRLFALLCFFYFHPGFGQDDFVSIYTSLAGTAERQNALVEKLKAGDGDKQKSKLYRQEYQQVLYDSILPRAKKVIHLTFPDISFTGLDKKIYSLSDFKDTQVVLNYNYLYCTGCMQRIDSTLELIQGKKVQLIVLFLMPYQKELEELSEQKENVLIGFISDDTEKLISLGLGDNAMYYLDENRQIEFFDKLFPEEQNVAWTNFLKTHL